MTTFVPATSSHLALEEQNVKASGQMLHPFIALLWVKTFAKQTMHCETYHRFVLVLVTAVMPYRGLKRCLCTLLRVSNIFPVGPELRTSALGAVLHAQKWSWIGFVRVLYLPSSWPLLSPDYSFVWYHDISLGQNQQIFLFWSEKIIKKKKMSKSWKKIIIWAFPKLNILTEGLETGRNLQCLQKQPPNYLIYTLNHQDTRQRGNSMATARCADVSLYIFWGTAEGLLEVEVHAVEDLPQDVLELRSSWMSWAFSVPVDI